jgi:hypothetical protein
VTEILGAVSLLARGQAARAVLAPARVRQARHELVLSRWHLSAGRRKAAGRGVAKSLGYSLVRIFGYRDKLAPVGHGISPTTPSNSDKLFAGLG